MDVNTSYREFQVTDVSADADDHGHHIVLFSFGEERYRAKCTAADRPNVGPFPVHFNAEGELDFAFEGLLAVEKIG